MTEKNYNQLQELYSRFKDTGLSVIVFPCNQFGSQEPGTEAEIKAFAAQYNVTFQMMSKIDVNGANAHPLFVWLKAKLPGTLGNGIKWNWTKFTLDRKGQPVKRYGPPKSPASMEDDIVALLGDL